MCVGELGDHNADQWMRIGRQKLNVKNAFPIQHVCMYAIHHKRPLLCDNEESVEDLGEECNDV